MTVLNPPFLGLNFSPKPKPRRIYGNGCFFHDGVITRFTHAQLPPFFKRYPVTSYFFQGKIILRNWNIVIGPSDSSEWFDGWESEMKSKVVKVGLKNTEIREEMRQLSLTVKSIVEKLEKLLEG